MMTILVQTGLKKVITRKNPKNLNQIKWEELGEKTFLQSNCASRIQSCKRY
ncbi:hypothetical protein Gotur_029489 [Gossypium turneri]